MARLSGKQLRFLFANVFNKTQKVARKAASIKFKTPKFSNKTSYFKLRRKRK